MDRLILFEDTRNKAGKHLNIEKSSLKYDVQLVRKKLDAGDYMVPGVPVTIDTKQDLQEVYCNLVKEHDRFRRECIRAREMGLRLVILVEQQGIRSVDDVKNWKNPRYADYARRKLLGLSVPKAPPVSSERLANIMRTMSENYGIEWRFCSKQNTFRTIIQIIHEYGEKNNAEKTLQSDQGTEAAWR